MHVRLTLPNKRAVSFHFPTCRTVFHRGSDSPKELLHSNVLRKCCLPKPARPQSLFICKDLKIFQMNTHKKEEASDTVQVVMQEVPAGAPISAPRNERQG